MPDLQTFLAESAELPRAQLLRTMLLQVANLGPDVRSEVEPFAVRFRAGSAVLCEFSTYGQLFIVRCGPGQSVEYRVRDEDVALRALDQILREYMQLRDTTSPVAP